MKAADRAAGDRYEYEWIDLAGNDRTTTGSERRQRRHV